MNPNDLRERVQEEIEEYVDKSDWEQHKLVEAAQQESVKKIAGKMAEIVG